MKFIFTFNFIFYFQDFLDQLKADKKRRKALWKIDIELREPSDEENAAIQNLEELQDSSENVVVLDDTVGNSSNNAPNDTNTNSSIVKQVTFNTTSTYQDTYQDDLSVSNISNSPRSEEIVPPKKSSRIVWQEHVEVME